MGQDCCMYLFLSMVNIRSLDEHVSVVFQWVSLPWKTELLRMSFLLIRRTPIRSSKLLWKPDKFGILILHSKRRKQSTISTAANNYLSLSLPIGVDSAVDNGICTMKF